MIKETGKGRKQRPRLHRDSEQSRRFIEAARAAGASEDETVFDENLKRVAKAKPTKDASEPPRKD
jgi:hypothetical protein